MLGATRSRLAATGLLRSVGEHVTEHGEVLAHAEFARALSSEDARAYASQYLRHFFGRAGEHVAESLSLTLGWNVLVERLLVQHDGAHARFSSVDDIVRAGELSEAEK